MAPLNEEAMRLAKIEWQKKIAHPFEQVGVVEAARRIVAAGTQIDRNAVGRYFKKFDRELCQELMELRQAREQQNQIATNVEELNENAVNQPATDRPATNSQPYRLFVVHGEIINPIENVEVKTVKVYRTGKIVNFEFPLGITDDIKELARCTLSEMHASATIQVIDPNRNDCDAKCVYCYARYKIFSKTNDVSKLKSVNILNHLKTCSMGGNNAFKIITQLQPAFQDKTNLYGRNNRPRINDALFDDDFDIQFNDENVDQFEMLQDENVGEVTCAFELGPAVCFCGVEIFAENERIVQESGRVATHYTVCKMLNKFKLLAQNLSLNQNPTLSDVTLVDPRVVDVHSSKVCCVYAHYLFDRPVTFDWDFPNSFTYFGKTCAILQRATTHRQVGSIDVTREIMFGLLECNDEEQCLDLESVAIVLFRLIKNSIIGYGRLLQMNAQQFEECARIIILALKQRFDHFEKLSMSEGSLHSNQLKLYEKARADFQSKFSNFAQTDETKQLKSRLIERGRENALLRAELTLKNSKMSNGNRRRPLQENHPSSEPSAKKFK